MFPFFLEMVLYQELIDLRTYIGGNEYKYHFRIPQYKQQNPTDMLDLYYLYRAILANGWIIVTELCNRYAAATGIDTDT